MYELKLVPSKARFFSQPVMPALGLAIDVRDESRTYLRDKGNGLDAEFAK
jgi:hypothetical protein